MAQFVFENTGGIAVDGAFHKVTITRSGSSWKKYIDDDPVVSDTSSLANYQTGTKTTLGRLGDNWPSNNFMGAYLDEARIKESVDSANHIAAEHANQNSYSTFYSVAAVAGGSTSAQAARRGAVMMM